MSNQGDQFSSGFLAGTIVGAIAGGFVGTWLATRVNAQTDGDETTLEGKASAAKDQLKRIRQRVFNTEDMTIEEARVGLDDKIAQLNDAIDQARQQLSKVNGTGIHQDS